MYCPECGTKLPENAKFCMECGNKVPPKPTEKNPNAISGNAAAPAVAAKPAKPAGPVLPSVEIPSPLPSWLEGFSPLMQQAKIFREQNQNEEALILAKEDLKTNNSIETLNFIFNCQFDLGKMKQLGDTLKKMKNAAAKKGLLAFALAKYYYNTPEQCNKYLAQALRHTDDLSDIQKAELFYFKGCLLRDGEQNAVEPFEQALEYKNTLSPSVLSDICSYNAFVFIQENKYEEAYSASEQAIQAAPEDWKGYCTRAFSGFYSENLEHFEEDSNFVLSSEEADEEYKENILNLQGLALMQKANMAEAAEDKINYLTESLNYQDRLEENIIADIYYFRALAYMELNMFDEAYQDGEAEITIAPQKWTGYYIRAVAGFNSNNFEHYEEDCQFVLDSEEADEESKQTITNLKGLAFYQMACNEENPAERINLINKCLASQDKIERDMLPDVYFLRASSYLELENYTAAYKDATTIINLNQKRWEGYYARAVAAFSLNHFKYFQDDCNIVLNSKDADEQYVNAILNIQGLALYQQAVKSDNNEEKIALLSKALEHSETMPEDTLAEIYYLRSTAYLETEKYDLAYQDGEAILQITPDNWKGHFARAYAGAYGNNLANLRQDCEFVLNSPEATEQSRQVVRVFLKQLN